METYELDSYVIAECLVVSSKEYLKQNEEANKKELEELYE